MHNTFGIIQIILSIFLVGLILIQTKGQGLNADVANSFGAFRSRRGLEKFIFYFTIILGVIFVLNSLVLLLTS